MDLIERLANNYKPPYLKKTKHLVLKNSRLNMSNWMDILADVYEERIIICLEKELDYGFFRGDTISYIDSLNFINRIGNSLKEVGVKRGDRVGMITTNRIELALAYFAAMKIGAIVVPLNAMFKCPEIKYVVENCGIRCLITDRAIYNASIQDTSRIPTIERWIMLTRRDVPNDFFSLSELMAAAGNELPPIEMKSDDIVAILYTSGTTGFPKGAMLTNESFGREVRRFTRVGGLSPTINRFKGIYIVPLAHVMGYVVMLGCFSMAVPNLFMQTFDPVQVLENIQKLGASFFMGVPTMYAMLLNAGIDNYDLSSMKVWGSAADALPSGYVERFKRYGGIRIFGKRILPPLFFEGYGQVETAGITTLLRHPFFFGRREPGCVGRPVRQMEVRLVDEGWNDVPDGGAGELVVRGPRVMKGYWDSPEMNREVFKGGWFKTGDLMKKDKKGRLHFVDREKDMIKVGGYSVFSKEVEEELSHHPKIGEVAVIGIRDEIKGQKPIAVVTLKPGERADADEILEWARDNIAVYKAPRRIEILKEMPYGMTLKIDKKELRKRYDR